MRCACLRRHQATTPQRQRVLVADDNADMRGYIARCSRSWYEVEAVADGERRSTPRARAGRTSSSPT